jgi:toxin ParE1/3/4
VSLRLVLERHAEDDLTERAAYIARENPAIAQAFLDAVERALARLADMPGIGSPRAFQHPRLAGIRMWPVPEYPSYLIFYRVAGDVLQVLRILRAAQDYTRFFREDDEDEG